MSMSINAINPATIYANLASRSGAAGRSNIVSPSLAQNEGDTASFSAEGLRRSASNSASGTSTTYDFTNMSQQELHAATSDLLKSGKLSFDEISLAVPLVQTPLAKVNYDGAWPENYTKPINFMSTLRDGLDAANSRGDSDSAKNITRLMSAFERVQGTPKS